MLLKTKIKRLELLVDMLNNHRKYFPKVKFNLESWLNSTNRNISCVLDGDCKTAACAIGSAMLYKPFNNMGLHGSYSGDFGCTNTFEPVYKTNGLVYIGWEAVLEFFNIDLHRAEHLFNSFSYTNYKATPKQVAKRVKAFIETLKE